MRRTTRVLPSPGTLWLSRPPYLLVARVTAVELAGAPGLIEYELLDEDGSLLCDPVREPLNSSWWANFQPLERNYG